MLKIYICEDNQIHRNYFDNIIYDTILIEEYDMHLELSTSDPNAILDSIKTQCHTGLYFLDIDLHHEINGIQLASKIREYDPRGFIVFVTTHAELTLLTFRYKVEAMDYIIKDKFNDTKSRIQDCMKYAHQKYTFEHMDCHDVLTIKVNGRLMNIDFNEILYIETSSIAHKLIVHTKERQIEFYYKMKEIASLLDERFYRCHNSYMINKDYIKEIDLKNRCIIMSNMQTCPISIRMLKGLLKTEFASKERAPFL